MVISASQTRADSRLSVAAVAHFPGPPIRELGEVTAFGLRYRIPVVTHTRTTLAVNVGGAVIPVILACYLVVHDSLWIPGLAATAGVAIVVHAAARPVPGVGIVCPALLPPFVAALCALAVSVHSVAAVAYICGTVGTLIGADLTNIHKIRSLGAPVASIGGAGTFDGIFLAGVLAVFLA